MRLIGSSSDADCALCKPSAKLKMLVTGSSSWISWYRTSSSSLKKESWTIWAGSFPKMTDLSSIKMGHKASSAVDKDIVVGLDVNLERVSVDNNLGLFRRGSIDRGTRVRLFFLDPVDLLYYEW